MCTTPSFVGVYQLCSSGDEDILITTGTESVSPAKRSLAHAIDPGKGKNPLKQKALAVIPNGDSTAVPPVGPASNTRSMQGQTDAAFVAAGGQPSLSIVPKKCPHKGKEASTSALSSFTHFTSSTPAFSAGPPSFPFASSSFPSGGDHMWKPTVTNLQDS